MERNTLSENVKLGMKQRALEGSWNGGIVFGYDTVKKELVINEKGAEVVKLIYHMYADGKGLRAISNHLNKAGYKTKRNRQFSINGVAQILDNVIYNGRTVNEIEIDVNFHFISDCDFHFISDA